MKQIEILGIVLSRRRRSLLWVAAGLGVFITWQALYAQAAPLAASFVIVSPEAGATIGSPVQLGVALNGTELGLPITGQDHLHISIDGGPAQAVYKNRVLNLPLEPGKHIIGVDLAGPTHRSLLPPKYVTFTVR